MSNYNRIFPKETTEGHVSLIGNKIITKSNNSLYESEIDIHQLLYIYIVVNRDGRSMLFLFDHYQHWIPSDFTGFRKMYEDLSNLLVINDVILFQNIFKKEKFKKVIWRKLISSNYQLISDKVNHDYTKGIEIQSDNITFIDWDTLATSYKNIEGIHYEQSPYDQTITKLNYPVRIGNIILNELTAFENKRDDVPILHFYTQCYSDDSSDKSYYELRDQLIKDFAIKDRHLVYERDDQKCYSFNAACMAISIVYTYDSEYGFESGYTSVEIKNERDYPELLIDAEYEEKAQLDRYFCLDEAIQSSSNYKFDQRIKQKFSKLKPESINKPIIWIDKINEVIGFADKKHYQVFKRRQIKRLTVQNVLPAKGEGGGYLQVNLSDNSYTNIFSGKCHVFDKYTAEISILTGIEVLIAEPYCDC